MKRKFCISGIVVSALAILIGFLIVAGAMGGDTGNASSASYLYDSGYASFGADFYSYVVNNAAEAASASRTVASNLNEIAKLFKNVFGLGFILFGSFGVCGFGVILGKDKDSMAAAQPETIPEVPAIVTTVISQEPEASAEESAAVEGTDIDNEVEESEMTDAPEEQGKTEE